MALLLIALIVLSSCNRRTKHLLIVLASAVAALSNIRPWVPLRCPLHQQGL